MSEEKKQEYIAENADAEADTIFGDAPVPAPAPVTKKTGTSGNTKLLLGGIGALVLLGGGLTAMLLLNQEQEEADSSPESSQAENITLNHFNADDVVSVEIINADSFTVTRELVDNTAIYSIDGYEDVALDNSLLSTIVSNGSKLEAASLVEEQPDDLAKYGLAEPAAAVTLHYADGNAFTFTVGDASPMTSSQTYCEYEGDVYLIRNSLIANYKKTADEFLSLSILAEPAKEFYPIVDSLRIERKDIDYDIYMEYDYENADDDSVGGTAATHVMMEPVFSYLSVDRSVAVTNGMFGLNASEIAVIRPTDADLKKAGLDDPFCSVTMACDNGSTYHLLLGDTYETEGGKTCYYAQFEDVPLIYGIAEENAVWATVQPGDITSANIFTSYVWSIASLELTTPDETILFEGEGIKQEDYEVTKNGEACNNERFRQLYQFLLNVYGEDLFMGDMPTGDPDLSVRLTTQDGRQDYTVSFYRQSGVKTIVARDNACFTIRTSCLEALLHNLDIFDDVDTDFQTTWQ